MTWDISNTIYLTPNCPKKCISFYEPGKHITVSSVTDIYIFSLVALKHNYDREWWCQCGKEKEFQGEAQLHQQALLPPKPQNPFHILIFYEKAPLQHFSPHKSTGMSHLTNYNLSNQVWKWGLLRDGIDPLLSDYVHPRVAIPSLSAFPRRWPYDLMWHQSDVQSGPNCYNEHGSWNEHSHKDPLTWSSKTYRQHNVYVLSSIQTVDVSVVLVRIAP